MALVEDVCGDVTVYDLQVEGEHNFFANGICVHNCIIVDDPVKDDKEGRSQVYRDDVWEWFTQTLWTRRHHDRVPVLVTMCMAGDTPVLMADGREKPLREVRPGDRIATYDQGRITATSVRRWSNQGPDLVFRIQMKSGVSVLANARHPFLSECNGRLEWQRTASLRKGSKILRAIGGNTKAFRAPQRDATSPRSAAARTITNGAGHPGIGRLRSILRHAVKRACADTMGSALRSIGRFLKARVASALSVASPLATTSAPIGAGSSVSTTAMSPAGCAGSSATTATSPSATERPRPCFSPRLTTFGTTLDEVVSVTAAGVEDVFDIQVDRTANFIANGLVSHNTRWHDDDIVGRITDKSNPKYAPKFADGWEHLRLAAIAEEDDPIGRAPGEALWPERYGVEALEEMRDANPVAFSALYQGDPAPEDGVFYLAEDIHTYDREDLERVRSSLVYYAASDHAVATTQINDLTCMGVFGVDPTGTAYLMPDLVWRRIDAEEAVEQMLRLIKAHKPRWWYAERGHITRAIGPFLKRRMQEESVYCPVIEDQPVADKTQRAQSARARAAQGKIRFPAFASWWPKAKSEMLRFPNARHDDFVDMLSTIGLKLQSHVVGTFKTPKSAPKEGTWAWQKEQWAREDEQSRRWG